ncbi:MAG TPA: DUF5005 domain-containing protein [Cyclobacteriaceae bacterium]|nr:DUF5005 domain-containing protein [Cytophagales bacterium]HRF32681.1 DUF5005 domain-containing protein [Cyclobacteriaceae bacterium]
MKKIIYITLVSLAGWGCKPSTQHTAEKLPVVEDTVFTNSFLPKGTRFTGGDGTYSVVLPDGRTVWIFGDSFIGGLTPDLKRLPSTPSYIRNSFVILQKDSLLTFQQGNPKDFKSMLIPPEVADGTAGLTELNMWYWPGDAFIDDGDLHVFVSKFSQKDPNDMWGFKFLDTELVTLSIPDFTTKKVIRFTETDSVHYGHAVLETEDYLYIYGLKNRFPYAARAKTGKVTEAWEFYTGSTWKPHANEAKPMLEFSGSEQFSVFNWENTYILIMQEGDFGKNIYSFTSESPVGPWVNKQLLYTTLLPNNCKECFTYNALAHPQYIENNQLLISYNTNSMLFQDHYDNALVYRPRFIRVPMQSILPFK